MAPTPPPFRFPPDFFANDCHRLTETEISALIAFLYGLQNAPFSPSFVEEKEGFFAGEFSPKRLVYWRLVTDGGGKLKCINVLKIQCV